MYCEIPVFQRCCFCLPLRGGILAFGYLRLVAHIVLMACVGIVIAARKEREFADMEGYAALSYDTPLRYVVLAMMALDTAMTFVLIFGGHRKNPLALKVFMWYSVVGVILQFVSNFMLIFMTNTEAVMSTALLSLVVGVYLIFCIRSEIIKRERSEDNVIVYKLHTPEKV